jgi:hypothetical protein
VQAPYAALLGYGYSGVWFLAPLAPKFFEELFLIQRLMAVHQFEQGIVKILGRGCARVVLGG